MVNILLGVTDDISIHVLREEDDFAMQLANYRELNFYPRPPRGGRPAEHMGAHTRQRNFYPRPPRGGRRKKRLNLSIGSKISIHVLREEDDGLILP